MPTHYVLVVDPDPIFSSSIKGLLEEQGHEITIAEDGAQALLCLAGKQFDLVVSEINLHYLSGFKLLEIMKSKNISTPVVIMTDDFEADSEMHALSLGAVEFIKKPFNRTVFNYRINNIMNNQRIL
jgi:beta-1,2-mannobiose phosphorylase / 1,2-beta-oligomannan phosphorylase